MHSRGGSDGSKTFDGTGNWSDWCFQSSQPSTAGAMPRSCNGPCHWKSPKSATLTAALASTTYEATQGTLRERSCVMGSCTSSGHRGSSQSYVLHLQEKCSITRPDRYMCKYISPCSYTTRSAHSHSPNYQCECIRIMYMY